MNDRDRAASEESTKWISIDPLINPITVNVAARLRVNNINLKAVPIKQGIGPIGRENCGGHKNKPNPHQPSHLVFDKKLRKY